MKAKKMIKWGCGVAAVILAALLLLIGSFIYATRYRITDIDAATSPDGTYEIVFQAVGEPDWPFGYSHARIVLKRNGETVIKHKFDVANDGGVLHPENWSVRWEENCVKVTITGEEQPDAFYTYFFDGTVRHESLAVMFDEPTTDFSDLVAENEKGESVFAIPIENFIDCYNRVYLQTHEIGYLNSTNSENWYCFDELSPCFGYASVRYKCTADKTVWPMPTISVYAPDNDEIYEIRMVFDDHGYRACEKLFWVLKQKGIHVQNHLLEGRHNGEYILSNLKTYLRFYGGNTETMIKTERLRLYPASREQMEAMIASEQDEELKKAYTEMLDGCLRHPDQWDWYAIWRIEKTDGTQIGDLCFKGLRENGIAEIGYGILEEHQGQGYATEAVQAACRWAFRHAEVKSLEAETEPGNAASQRVLEKCGFRPNGALGEEGPRFSLSRCMDATEGTK